MTLRAAPHTVDVYRRTTTGTGPLGEPWARVAQGVPMDIQYPSGKAQAEQYGRVAVARYKAFAAHDADIRADDGLLVTSSEIPAFEGRRFLVLPGISIGQRGGWQGTVEDTQEDFGEDE